VAPWRRQWWFCAHRETRALVLVASKHIIATERILQQGMIKGAFQVRAKDGVDDRRL
jgi:hypothetical protein